MYKEKENIIYVGGKKFVFNHPIISKIDIANKIILVIAPEYISKVDYNNKIEKLNGSNVYFIDKTKLEKQKINYLSTGVQYIDEFWIKNTKEADNENTFWLTTNNEAHLISVVKMETIRSINTHNLK